jgi:hypothetical protein
MQKSAMTKLFLLIPTTVLLWFLGVGIYGYLWVNHLLETETLYGYERSRLLISSAFLVYKVPYLFIALGVVLGLEVLLVSWFVLRGKLCVAIVIVLVGIISINGQTQRSVGGIIYFTNNTPKDVRTFPVEILKANKKVAVTYPDEHHRFAFSNLTPGRYLLRLTWPKHCVLSYRLDLSKQSADLIKVIMDAECAHNNGRVRDLPSN